MLAELEFAAWDFKGNRMWSTFVEPPWVYDVKGERIELDVMGERSSFAATTRPKPSAPAKPITQLINPLFIREQMLAQLLTQESVPRYFFFP